MKRILIFICGMTCRATSFATLLIGFIGNFAVAKSIDPASGTAGWTAAGG